MQGLNNSQEVILCKSASTKFTMLPNFCLASLPALSSDVVPANLTCSVITGSKVVIVW